jgi:hypothetical protein
LTRWIASYSSSAYSAIAFSGTTAALFTSPKNPLLDRNAPGDRERARELIAAGRAEAETLGMARELVRFERLTARLANAATA